MNHLDEMGAEQASLVPLDLESLILIFRRRIGLFCSVFTLIFGISVLVTFQAVPLFQSTASVIIDPQENEVTDFEAALAGGVLDSALVDTEVQIIKSRSLIGRVVKKLDLTQDPEFNKSLQEISGLALFAQGIKDYLSALLPERSEPVVSEDVTERLEYEGVVNKVFQNLSVGRQGRSYIVNISFTSEKPWKAAAIANELADEYLVEQLEGKFESTARSNSWLDERLSELRSEVRVSEQAVEKYRAQSGLLSAQGSSLSEQQISDLNSQFLIQKAEFDGAVARLNSVKVQIEQGAGAETIGEVLSSDVIRDLRKQESEIAGRRAELASRYGTLHPEVKKVERETIDVKSQINQEVQRIILSLEAEVNVAREKMQSIETGLSVLKRELTANNQSLVRLRELERNANASRALYENFLSRFKETGQQGTIAQADARIVSVAALPTAKKSPKTTRSLILGMLIGILVGFVFIILAEYLDNGFSTGDEVEGTLNIQFISSIPLIRNTIPAKLKKLVGPSLSLEDQIVEKPLSSFAESYRALRSSILLSNIDTPPKVVMVSSALPNESKTVSSFCLGRISAMSGSRTLVIDCDLRRRGLTSLLRSKCEFGLIQVLNGEKSFDEVVIKDNKTTCDFLPLSHMTFTPRDVFGSEGFRELLTILQLKYDLVVLDTAPVLAVTETRMISNLVDGVIIAVKWRKTKKDAVKTATKILRNANANIIGAYLTQVNFNTRGRYGYGDNSYYNKEYREYYS